MLSVSVFVTHSIICDSLRCVQMMDVYELDAAGNLGAEQFAMLMLFEPWTTLFPSGLLDSYYCEQDDCCDEAPPSALSAQAAAEDSMLYLIEQIVIKLDDDCNGTLSADEVKELFSKLSGRPVSVIPDDHPEVLAFAGLSIEAVIEKLWKSAKPAVIEKYYRVMFNLAPEDELPKRVAPIVSNNPNQADLYLIEQIVMKLDSDCNGTLSADEVKELFSKLSGRPVSVIPDDHPEVLAFAGLPIEAVIDKLWKSAKPAVIEKYYRAIFNLAPEDELPKRFVPPSVTIQQDSAAAASAASEAAASEAEDAADHADRFLVEQIIHKLDEDDNGSLSADEVKFLFSKLSGRPVSVIPDDHPEVLAFAGLPIEAVIDKLWNSAKPAVIEKYYRVLFALAPEDELPSRAKEAAEDAEAAEDTILAAAREELLVQMHRDEASKDRLQAKEEARRAAELEVECEVEVKVKAPSVECEVEVKVKAPSVEVKMPSVELKVKARSCEVSLEVKAPSVEVMVPLMDVKVKAPSCELAVDLKAPSLAVKAPQVDAAPLAGSLGAGLIFDQVDKDADGKLTEAEFAAWADRNRDHAHEFLAVLCDADFDVHGDRWLASGLFLSAPA